MSTVDIGKKYVDYISARTVYACNQKAQEYGIWVEILEKSNTGWTPHSWLDGKNQFFFCGNEKLTVCFTINQLLSYILMHNEDIKNINTSIGIQIPIGALEKFKSFNNLALKKDSKIKDLLAIAAKRIKE